MTDRFKFRVWAKPHEPTQTPGYYVDDADYIAMFPNGEVEVTYFTDNGYTCSTDGFEQDEIIVEQCTGLRDKNGKLIYEGDIAHYVKHTNFGLGGERYAKVFWWENIQGFAIETNYGDYYGLTDFELEVIGNIHENPELLESEER